jgi:hypothetical protein
VLSLKYILYTDFPGEETAWTEYMQRCDSRIQEPDPMKRWEAAQNVLYKKSNAKYWSKEKRLDRSRENEKGET